MENLTYYEICYENTKIIAGIYLNRMELGKYY